MFLQRIFLFVMFLYNSFSVSKVCEARTRLYNIIKLACAHHFKTSTWDTFITLKSLETYILDAHRVAFFKV